ncbi:MAG: DUF559 domain-containing protein [Afipia sp.]|nr:DUF559 domain-containing protein [Afipia sp.]
MRDCAGCRGVSGQLSDIGRDRWLNDQGFRVLRFWNNEVLNNTDAVRDQIVLALHRPVSPSPGAACGAPPSPTRGEGIEGQ